MKKEKKKSISNEWINFLKTIFAAEILSKGSSLYKILTTVLKMDKGRTQKNGPEDKKTNVNA